MAKVSKDTKCPKFTEEIKNLVVEKLKANNELKQKDIKKIIQEETNKSIDISTISRHLSTLGDYKNPLIVPLISPKNIEKRLDYAILYFLLTSRFFF